MSRLEGRRLFLRQIGALSLAACGPATLRSQPRTRTPGEIASAVFDERAREARRRLRRPPLAPPEEIPEELRGISYDLYRQIRFRPNHSLWRDRNLLFEAQLFHRGFYYGRDVSVFVHDERGAHPLPFDPASFEYPRGLDPSRFRGLGFAGLRLHAPLNTPDYHDEVLAFLGASYFRALGRGNAYGLSARCLGIDTGLDVPEEFPEIVALHLVTSPPSKPSAKTARSRMWISRLATAS